MWRSPSLLLECDLCQRWEILSSTSFRFHLRPDIRWHDIPPVSGRLLTAKDVACSYERQTGRKLTPDNIRCSFDPTSTPDLPNAFLLANLQEIEIEGEATLTLNLDPIFPMQTSCCLWPMAIAR